MKKITSLSFTACLLLCVGFISSCDKDDDDRQKTRSELLIGTWVLTSDAYSPAYDYDWDGNTETEIFNRYDACDKDDLTVFNAGGTGTYDEGPTKCDQSDPQSIPFAWSLTNNDNSLVVGGDTYNVVQLDQNTLKVSYTFVEGGTTFTNTYTFSRR